MKMKMNMKMKMKMEMEMKKKMTKKKKILMMMMMMVMMMMMMMILILILMVILIESLLSFVLPCLCMIRFVIAYCFIFSGIDLSLSSQRDLIDGFMIDVFQPT